MTPARFDLLLTNVRLATLRDGDGYGAILDAALGVRGGAIAWVGAARELPRDVRATKTIDARQRWATPGLIDCHTHLVYAGNRANEFEQRLEGATYEDIARGGRRHPIDGAGDARGERRGAGRRKRAAATGAARARRHDGRDQVRLWPRHGERAASSLRVARRLGDALDVDVRTTLLAAHALPPEFAGRADAYIDLRVRATRFLRPRAKGSPTPSTRSARRSASRRRRRGACSRPRARSICPSSCTPTSFPTAAARRWPPNSARCPPTTSNTRAKPASRRWRSAGTVAVLLPGAFYALRETRLPPIDALRAHGVPIAIATDCNPGTSPATSLPLMMNMACTLFRLTPREALAGATRNAARALGLADRGALAVGQRADFALWDIDEPAELAYRIGGEACAGVIREGRVVRGARSDAARGN